MARVNTVDLILSDADDDCIFLSDDPDNNATLTLDGASVSGGVATLDFARRVVITSGGDDTDCTFLVSGTDRHGYVISESITGANNGAAVSNKDFKTVTGVSITGDAGTVKIGTNTKGSSDWVVIDTKATPVNVGVGCTVTAGASLNYTVEYTYDDVQELTNISGSATTNVFAHATIASKTANFDGAFTTPIRAFRITLNTWTSGTVRMSSIQAGI